MQLNLANVNWLGILACVVASQLTLTVWFVALFGKPWAEEYGAADAKQHAKEIPGYTYAIGAACVFLLSVGLALLQDALKVQSVGEALALGFFVAVHLSIATALPGYAFLRRYKAFLLAIGSQTVVILLQSAILVAWH